MRAFAFSFAAYLALLCAPAFADTPALRFQTLTIEDGLAQNSVTSIAEDSAGYLWFGSQDGLNRYDGLRFTTFKNDPNDSRSIPANYITALLPDGAGDIWVGTRFKGLAHYDAASATFTPVPLVYEGGVTDTRFIVHALAMIDGTLWAALDRGLARRDSNGRLQLEPMPGTHAFPEIRALLGGEDDDLWIGALGRVLHRFADGTYDILHFSEPDTVVHALAMQADHVLIAGTSRGLYRLAGNAFERIDGVPAHLVTTLERDHDGGLWAGTRGAAVFYLPARAANETAAPEWQHFTYRAEDRTGIGQNIIFDIHADRDGVLWVGTYGGGLSRAVLAQRRFGLQQQQPNGLNSNIIFPILDTGNGTVWIGTYNDGLNRWNRSDDTWKEFRNDPDDPGSLAHDEVRSLLMDAAGRLWVGTHGGLDRLDPGAEDFVHYRHDPDNEQSIAHNGITVMLIDSNKRFWVGTWGGGLDLFDPKRGTFIHYRHNPDNENSISTNLISDIVEGPGGDLWISTEGGGLNRFDPQSGRFEVFRHRDNDPQTIANDTVTTLWFDAAGYLWAGTFNGLDRIDTADGSIRHYRESDGLANNLVLGVLGDDAGNLWISTNRGLSRLDPRTGSFHTFHRSDGLQSDEYNSYAYAKNARGELFFGGIGGFNVFDPATITPNLKPPEVRITGMTLFNMPLVPEPGNPRAILQQPADHTDAITLAYEQNLFTIEFAALAFADPARNRFAYRLKGFNESWLETGAAKPFATFTNLDSGEYVFEVRAANADGTWNETPARLGITVTPPLWRTPLAYIAYAIMLAALALLILQYQRKRIEVRYLAREKASAEKATRLKSSFLALMSHEIRTPMNGVLGMVQLISRTRLSRRQRGYIEALEKSGESLLTILDDVLDFSRIEADVIEFESVPFDLREVAESVILLLGTRAREKGLALAFRADNLPAAVNGDPTRLRQVLINLVSNAIKFTQAGGVKMRVAEQVLDDTRVRITFTVEDTGIGISAVQQSRLFDAFTQADSSTQRTYGGTGLGLSICKRLVEMQGGEIGVESEPGAGSVFWFQLDFEIATAPPRVDAMPVRAGRMLRVLLVEDQPINQEVARGLLEHDGHAVSVAPDGQTALRLISEREFDVVLMDIHMPGMDGRETTRRIRALDDPVKAGIPVLGLTASISADDVSACLNAGMNKVLRKPLPAARLAEALARLDDDAETIPAQEDDLQLIDPALLMQHRNALGEERFQGILATFRQTALALVDDLETAARAQDHDTLRRDAHRLAGAASSMGCGKLATLAMRVEQDVTDVENLRSVYRQTDHALRALERVQPA